MSRMWTVVVIRLMELAVSCHLSSSLEVRSGSVQPSVSWVRQKALWQHLPRPEARPRKSGPECNHDYGRLQRRLKAQPWQVASAEAGGETDMEIFAGSTENSELPDFLRPSGPAEVSTPPCLDTLQRPRGVVLTSQDLPRPPFGSQHCLSGGSAVPASGQMAFVLEWQDWLWEPAGAEGTRRASAS